MREQNSALTARWEEEKKDLKKRRDLNELGYEELAMSIDTTKKKGRVAFDHLRVTKNMMKPDRTKKNSTPA